MSKRKSKAVTRASTAKAAVTKSSAAPAGNGAATLIVLGYDDQQKPRDARFDHDKPDLVTKAAELMGLKVYQATSEDVAAIAEKLPVGRLRKDDGFMPVPRFSETPQVLSASQRHRVDEPSQRGSDYSRPLDLT